MAPPEYSGGAFDLYLVHCIRLNMRDLASDHREILLHMLDIAELLLVSF